MGQSLEKQQSKLVFGYVNPKYVLDPLLQSESDTGIELEREAVEQIYFNKVHNGIDIPHRRSSKNNLKPILFGQLSSLSQIGLCSHGIVKLSPNIGLLKDSKVLQVCCNHLKSIPIEIGYMKNLTILSLSQNRLTELPESIGFLTKLVELRCSMNSIYTIPKSIISLKKLTHLHLDSNRFTSLIPEVGELKNLVVLDLSNNPLNAVPSEISKLKYLKNLFLENCPLLTEFELPELFFEPLALKELCARFIVRYRLDITSGTPDFINAYLKTVKECSFCGGPYFERSFVRGKFIQRNNFINPNTGEPIPIPMVYRLCYPHWSNEMERVKQMFTPLPETAPPKTLAKSSSTSSLFNAFNFPKDVPVNQETRRRRSSTPNIMLPNTDFSIPLASLAPQPQLPELEVKSMQRSKSLNNIFR